MDNADKEKRDTKKVDEIKSEQTEKVLDEQVKMPSILVDEYMKNMFTESFSEELKKQEEDFRQNLGENIKYVERLEGTPYNFTSKGFTCVNSKECTTDFISNFLAVPVKKIDFKSEEAIKSNIELKGFISPTGKELPNITESIQNIENGRCFTNSLWWTKVKFEIPPKKNIQINCVKELCKYIEEEIIYQYIGVTKINDKRVFLHTGGAIGIKDKIKVDLGDEVLNKFSLTNKKFKIKDTLKISLQCLEVAPINITLPILALVFMAPLTSTFEELGIPIGFLTWVLGPQQCKKTSMTASFCSHFRIV